MINKTRANQCITAIPNFPRYSRLFLIPRLQFHTFQIARHPTNHIPRLNIPNRLFTQIILRRSNTAVRTVRGAGGYAHGP